jgi:hypothetical protein
MWQSIWLRDRRFAQIEPGSAGLIPETRKTKPRSSGWKRWCGGSGPCHLITKIDLGVIVWFVRAFHMVTKLAMEVI